MHVDGRRMMSLNTSKGIYMTPRTRTSLAELRPLVAFAATSYLFIYLCFHVGLFNVDIKRALIDHVKIVPRIS